MEGQPVRFVADDVIAGVERFGDYAVLRLVGEVGGDAAAQVRLVIMQLIAEPPHRVVIDLSGVTAVDAAGVRVLLTRAQQAHESGGVLGLVGLSESVASVLRLAGVTAVAPVLRTLSDVVPPVPA